MIAVTGATGLIGSSVVRQLLNNGKSVRVLVRKGSNMSNVSGLDVEVFEGTLLTQTYTYSQVYVNLYLDRLSGTQS